jgi:hypothetical protein
MGVFSDLLEKLQADCETVHGRRLPLEWQYDPDAEPASRWTARIRGGTYPHNLAEGPSGEDPLRRLAERYAELAKGVREQHAPPK